MAGRPGPVPALHRGRDSSSSSGISSIGVRTARTAKLERLGCSKAVGGPRRARGLFVQSGTGPPKRRWRRCSSRRRAVCISRLRIKISTPGNTECCHRRGPPAGRQAASSRSRRRFRRFRLTLTSSASAAGGIDGIVEIVAASVIKPLPVTPAAPFEVSIRIASIEICCATVSARRSPARRIPPPSSCRWRSHPD